jgi:acyl-CoA reductase-like NAD-dependent aldehyde dehydrogenase
MATIDSARLSKHVNSGLLRELESRAAIAGRDSIDVIAPFTLDVIGRVPQSTNEDVVQAAATVRAAQPAWESLGAGE